MTHAEFEELAAAYSLGALSEEEKQKLKSLLSEATEEEKQLLADFDSVATLLGLSAESVVPRPQVKDRLLDMVKREATPASDSQMRGFTTVFANEGHWKLLAKGISAKILYKDTQHDASTMLLRMEAGSQLEGHPHAMMEELYMLEGDCLCAGKVLKAGDYHRAAPNTTHEITSTRQGCLMLIISRGI